MCTIWKILALVLAVAAVALGVRLLVLAHGAASGPDARRSSATGPTGGST